MHDCQADFGSETGLKVVCGKGRKNLESLLFPYMLGAFGFFRTRFLCSPALFFWLRARKREKSEGAHPALVVTSDCPGGRTA